MKDVVATQQPRLMYVWSSEMYLVYKWSVRYCFDGLSGQLRLAIRVHLDANAPLERNRLIGTKLSIYERPTELVGSLVRQLKY